MFNNNCIFNSVQGRECHLQALNRDNEPHLWIIVIHTHGHYGTRGNKARDPGPIVIKDRTKFFPHSLLLICPRAHPSAHVLIYEGAKAYSNMWCSIIIPSKQLLPKLITLEIRSICKQYWAMKNFLTKLPKTLSGSLSCPIRYQPNLLLNSQCLFDAQDIFSAI